MPLAYIEPSPYIPDGMWADVAQVLRARGWRIHIRPMLAAHPEAGRPSPIASLSAYQVIVLEGCDGVGKTTLAEALAAQHGYTVIHSGRTPDGTDLADHYGTILALPGRLVLDRSFISELVYGPLDRGRSRLSLPAAVTLTRRVAKRSGVLISAYHNTFVALRGVASY